MARNILIISIVWLAATAFVAANPVRKILLAGGFEREYLIYTPLEHPQREKADGIIVCLHGFGRSMNDFFDEYNLSNIADSLNLIIAAPQALPEQDPQVLLDAATINSLTNNMIPLHSVWGCGLSVGISLFGINLFNDELNKDIDDVDFIDRMIDQILSEYSLPAENLFILGTSMGGYMTYQFALRKGERLSGIVSIAGSMGLAVKGMNYAIKLPICDFHSVTDEVVPYTGSMEQFLSVISLAMPKTDVINYWTKTNATGDPVVEPIQYYPSTNGITVEKTTYPEEENEVIHYKINGAPHNYFFKKEAGDCMDYAEEIVRFVQSHFSKYHPQSLHIPLQTAFFYPNPVQDKIYFDTGNSIVSIYDIAGMQLFSQSFVDGKADLSFLKSGIYFIRIQSENTIRTGKLIKR